MKEKTGNRIIQIILLVIIVCGIVVIIFMLNQSGEHGPGMPGAGPQGMGGPGSMESESENSMVAVEAERIERSTLNQYIRINGDVVSDIAVDIYPDVSGKLVEKKIEVGSYICKGDVIAVVDPSIPGTVYSKSNVVSTIAGTVTDVNVNIGDTVNSTTSIAVIGDLSNLSIVTYVPERYIRYLKTGLTAEVLFEAIPGKILSAKLVQLDPVVNTDSRSLKIKLEIIDPEPQMKAGMFASMKLITQERVNCISVANISLSEYYDESVVYVLGDSDVVERRVVETGLVSDERTEILSGIEEGEVVITQGISSIVDGTSVRVVNQIEVDG